MNDPGAPERSDRDPERDDEQDHDLLTFGEVGARLRAEIHAMRGQVAALAVAEPVDEAALAVARARLAALDEAARRNAAGSINDDNFERFFGYPGKARRNT
jgi:hypothetical protein